MPPGHHRSRPYGNPFYLHVHSILYLDAGAVLGLNVVNLAVGVLVDPDQVKVVAGVVVDVVGTELLGEVTESLVLPATSVLAFFHFKKKRN